VTYIIDGHNLIPKIAGLSLSQMDDETRLVDMLQVFARLRRVRVEVFFDRAPAGHSGTRKIGTITVHSVPEGMLADDAIVNHLRKAGKSAKGMTVVTSDRRVQAEARALQAEVLPSEAFAKLMQTTLIHGERSGTSSAKMSDQEVDAWLKEFGEGDSPSSDDNS